LGSPLRSIGAQDERGGIMKDETSRMDGCCDADLVAGHRKASAQSEWPKRVGAQPSSESLKAARRVAPIDFLHAALGLQKPMPLFAAYAAG
jgi:hypothetical protein